MDKLASREFESAEKLVFALVGNFGAAPSVLDFLPVVVVLLLLAFMSSFAGSLPRLLRSLDLDDAADEVSFASFGSSRAASFEIRTRDFVSVVAVRMLRMFERQMNAELASKNVARVVASNTFWPALSMSSSSSIVSLEIVTCNIVMLHIALLICDTPVPDVLIEHGDYHRMFSELLSKSNSAEYSLDPYEVRQLIYPDPDKYDALILTGSAASAYDDKEWISKLVEYVAQVADTKPHIKLIGICFGQQIIARAVGGGCVPNNGKWEVGPTPLALTPLGQKLFGVETLNIQQMHRDHVPSIPDGFELLGSTDICMNQGMVKFTSEKIQIFAVQGHPEFTEPIVSKIVQVRSAAGVIDPATAEDAARRKDWRNDGLIVGQAIWKVMLDSTE